MKALFITGEASGDLHASNLINSLYKISPETQFIGIGGDNMKKEGVRIIYPSEEISVLGFSEILSKLSNIKEARRAISKCVKKYSIDFAVTVDFPGFNIPIARYLKNQGIPVFYFITPQVWAWGGWRVKHLRKYFRHLFVILPFEEDFFRGKGVRATYLGNPLLDITISSSELKKNELLNGEPLVAILPGSRESEIKRLLLPMIKGFNIFHDKYKKSSAVIALHNEKMRTLTGEIVGDLIKDIPIIHGRTHDILKLSDIAVITSGTATIEAGILNTPMVVVYKLSFLSWLIAKILIRVKHVGLINLILSGKIMPELIQNEVTEKNIAEELDILYKRRDEILEKLSELRQKLGVKGVYDRIAKKLLSMV